MRSKQKLLPGQEADMRKIGQLVAALRERSRVSWALATALVSGSALANPADNIRSALCNIYTNVLSNTGLIFAVVLIIIAWAGYMIYMGKREASDVIIKAVIATAVLIGATQLANWILGGNNNC
jgi:type IV secretory pathway VirB2 component (pilin)